ncbi:hypothetical protein EON64_01705 [archaeon]|nr:MAG: hypothetical protein EON64_01705 [archaeon]
MVRVSYPRFTTAAEATICICTLQALVRHMGSADVTEELLRAIGCISATLPSTRSTLVENSIGDFVMKALEQNMQCDSVVEQGFYALSRILAVTDEFSLENDHVALQQVAVHKLTKDERRMFMSATYGLLQNNAMKLIAKLSFKHSEDSSVLALYTVQVIASLLIGAHLLDERSKPEDKGGSNKSAADSSLNSFGSGGACAVLCALLTKYRQDASIVFWCLFGLTHLSTSLTLVNLMRSSDVSSLLVHVLEIYLPSNKGIVNMCFEIITNLCIDPNCRGILGNALYKGTDNSHIVLSSLRYHFHDARVVASACKAINALCFSPAEDAYSSLFEARKGADNVKMRSEVEENSATPATRRTSGSVSSASEWSSFSENTDHLNQVIKMEESGPSPQDSAGQDSSDASSSGATSLMKRLSVLRWIGKAGDEDSPSGTGQPTSRSNPTISANYEQSLNVVQEGGNLIMDAAKALISTGLSDQEEKMILALKQRTSQRKNSNDALVECGCFVVLKQIFTSYSSNNFVLIQAVNALNSLALHPANRIKIKDSSVLLEALVAVYAAAVEKYTWDYLKDLWDTSTHDMLESDWNRVLVILCSITLGTVCLQEANKANSSEASREMQIAAVRANQLVLENLSVLNTMCSALSKGSKDVPLCEALLRAFHLVVANNEANQQKVGEMLTTDEYNVLFLIVQILREKMEVPRVAYYACAAIASIASGHEANSAKFNDFGVCKLVLRVLSRYMDYEEVVEAACQAVFGLKLLNDTLGQGGACEYVLQALTLHPSSSAVAEWVCRAIGSLAESKFNKIEFEKHQVAKVITSTLQRHVGSEGILSAAFTKDKSSAGVAQWGCTAIYYLAKGYDAESFQRRLVSVGACEAVAKALMKYAEVESVAYSCCRALVVLVDGNEALRSKPVLSGVCQYVVESLHLFPSSVLMAKWGCRAAAVLAESHEANIAKLGKLTFSTF